MKVAPVTIAEAKRFIAVWHRHHKRLVGALFAVGLEHDGELVGVATCGRPKARMLDDGEVAEVTRLCTRPECPKGGGSKLLNACRKAAAALGYAKLVTYTLAAEGGATCRGAGWVQAELLRPRGGWSCKSRRRGPGAVDNLAKIRWEVELGGEP